eukprot:698181-Amphidinium_carterae.1
MTLQDGLEHGFSCSKREPQMSNPWRNTSKTRRRYLSKHCDHTVIHTQTMSHRISSRYLPRLGFGFSARFGMWANAPKSVLSFTLDSFDTILPPNAL